MNKIILRMLVAAVCAAQALPSVAQKIYTVDECKEMALTNNARMKNAKSSLEGAEETRKEAFTNYFPQISATGLGFNANKDMLAMSLMGMDVSMMKDGITAGVTAVQPVFAGGQIINGNKLAKVGVDVSKLQVEQAYNEINLNAEKYFWQVVTLEEKLRTINVVDSMLGRLQSDVEVSVKAGVAMRNDLLQVELKRNEIESTRIKLRNGIALSKMLLAQYMGETDTTFVLYGGYQVGIMPESPASMKIDHSSALLETPEYRLLEKNVEANKLQQKLTVGKYLPTVGVGAGYMYHNVLEKDRSFGVVFAQVSVPLSGWWGGSHAIRRQKTNVLNAQTDLSDKSQLLMINMQNAWNNLDDSYKQLAIACKSINQSAENLRLNNEYYRAGTSSMTDLLNAQTSFQQARDTYVDAYSAYKIKTVEYLQSTGR